MHILYIDAYFELLSCIQVILSADLLVLVQSQQVKLKMKLILFALLYNYIIKSFN